MALTVLNDSISSNRTTHTAHLLPGYQPLWEESWFPGQTMNGYTAHIAMALADMVEYDEQEGRRLTIDIIEEAANIGAHPDAPHTATTRTNPSKSGQLSDPEAGG